MVHALVEAGIAPDLVIGTSIGALNGAIFAAEPGPLGASALRSAWTDIEALEVMSAPVTHHLRTLVSSRVSIYQTDDMRSLLRRLLPVETFSDLAVPFQCVAAVVETAAERWFHSGSLVEAVAASSAVPGLFPPVEIDGAHHYDGGLVNSLPIDRAVALGATTIYALQVGRFERPLQPPHRMYEVALVAFEIARRNRFAASLGSLPVEVTLHLLPSGNPLTPSDRRQLRWRDLSNTEELIDTAYQATTDYLQQRADT
jgi:NTE family protein